VEGKGPVERGTWNMAARSWSAKTVLWIRGIVGGRPSRKHADALPLSDLEGFLRRQMRAATSSSGSTATLPVGQRWESFHLTETLTDSTNNDSPRCTHADLAFAASRDFILKDHQRWNMCSDRLGKTGNPSDPAHNAGNSSAEISCLVKIPDTIMKAA
jgi:hypothetical protein